MELNIGKSIGEPWKQEIEKRLKELHPNKEGFQTVFQFKDNDDFKKCRMNI